jgi:hypothetical protein
MEAPLLFFYAVMNSYGVVDRTRQFGDVPNNQFTALAVWSGIVIMWA